MKLITNIQSTNDMLAIAYPTKHKPITLNEVKERTAKGGLLGIDTNAKTVKGYKQGFMTGILYLAPSNLAGFNVCPFASKGCKAACLNSAGRGLFYSVQRARIVKTFAYYHDRDAFARQLDKEIKSLAAKADKLGLTPCVRLNGTSDLLWQVHHLHLFTDNPDMQFYDYTKSPLQFKVDRPENYHLTYSFSDDTKSLLRMDNALEAGLNVAVVFRNSLPQWWLGLPVVDGDVSDLRFLDAPGVIVGLKAKGKARKDTSGFVIDANLELEETA